MTSRRLFLFALIIAVSAIPALAGRLADLPWDEKIPSAVRSSARWAVEGEASELSKKTNDQGKRYIYAHTSQAVELLPDGSALSYLTIQRCLPDRMVTERWRYTLHKKGKDYEIANREKIAESSDELAVVVEKAEQARPLKPFTLKHDLLELRMDSGSFVFQRLGDRPSVILIGGAGRLKITPLNDFESMFFERRLKRKDIDTAVSEVSISFHPDNSQFLDLIGHTPGQTGGGAGSSDLSDLVREVNKNYEGKEFTPEVYSAVRPPEERGVFQIRFKTADHGWLVYDVDPNRSRQIGLVREKSSFSLRSGDAGAVELISVYDSPEVREAPPLVRERRREGIEWLRTVRYDAQFDIDADRFTTLVDIEAVLLHNARAIEFFLGGNPSVRFVRLWGQELNFIPFPNPYSTIYGFEQTNNFYRVPLPEEHKAGTTLRLQVAYESPKLVQKIDEGFWAIQRGGFLPFAGALGASTYMHFVMRTPERYTHISIGSKLSEEVADGYRMTEWGADQGFNFATMIIGRYYTPIEREWNGVKVTGYQTRSQQENELTNQHLQPQVEEAVEALGLFTKIFGTPYAFKDLKIVGTPLQFSWSQSPSSVIYVGQLWMLSEADIASWFRANPSSLRGSTSHEVAHQWFGGQVESMGEHYWFVEVFCEVLSGFYRQYIGDKAGLKAKVDDWRTSALAADWQTSIKEFYRAENFIGQTMYYSKGPLVFWMLREYFGERALLQYLRNIIQVYGGDLITTYDLELLAERTFGQKMDWFFDQYIRGLGIPEVRYHFDAPRPAEDGQGWIVTGKLTQEIMIQGSSAPGKAFRNLLVPITFSTDNGAQVVKEYMDGPEKDLRIRLESKPSGSPKVNDGNAVYMTVKEM